MDRDSNFRCAFRTILNEADVEPVRLHARSPNLNSHLERFHLSLKSECLDRMIFCGESSLRNAVGQFRSHFHGERNDRGLGNKIIDPREEVGQPDGEIECREALAGCCDTTTGKQPRACH